MKFSILTRAAQSAQLMVEWTELYRQAGQSLFQNPYWHRIWWNYLGHPGGWEPYTVVAYTEGRLVALAPLAISWVHGVRRLEWAGMHVFDYPDILIAPGADPLSVWRAIKGFGGYFGGYDVAQLRDVRADGSSAAALQILARETSEVSRVYAIDLSQETSQSWFSTLSKRTRANHAAALRRLERMGPTFVEQVTDSPAVLSTIRQLVEQKVVWAAERQLPTIFTDGGIRTFLENLALQALSGRNLHLSILRCGDEAASVHLGFVSDDGFYYYMPSYHSGFAAMSPGRVHLIELVKWAIDNGCRRFDFLRGEDPYKAAWGKQSRQLHDFMFARGVVGQLALNLHGLRQWIDRSQAR